MKNVQEIIREGVRRSDINLKELSLAIGRNHAYMQQYLERGVPREFPVQLLPKIAEILDIPLGDLVDKDLLHRSEERRVGKEC